MPAWAADADALETPRRDAAAHEVPNSARTTPTRLGWMNNLALSYATLGRQDEALKLNEEAQALKKAKFGPDHPATLGSMNNLALMLQRPRSARRGPGLGQETVAVAKAKLGTRPPHHAREHGQLGPHLPQPAANTVTPSIFMKRRWRSRKANSVPITPLRLTSCKIWPAATAAIGRHGEAITLYEQTLALREPKLGPDHPDTLASMFVACQAPGYVPRSQSSVTRAGRWHWPRKPPSWRPKGAISGTSSGFLCTAPVTIKPPSRPWKSPWSCAKAATVRLVLPGHGPLANGRQGEGASSGTTASR